MAKKRRPQEEHEHASDKANRDPITGEPGSHPVGAGVGAAGGGATGAAIGGAIGGPGGALVGAVAGGLIGGVAGKGIAEKIDPSVEEAYWREHYTACDYVRENEPFEAFAPAYRLGVEGYGRYYDKGYDKAEPELQREYEQTHSEHNVDWERARPATRDAWHRVEKALPRPSEPE
jgi:hypothetical protein